MDSVRFGRVLGIGARLAAQTAMKTVVGAVDAAAAPSPAAPPRASSPPSPASSQIPPAATQSAGSSPASNPAHHPRRTSRPTSGPAANSTRTAGQLRDVTRGVAHGSRRFGQAVWAPLARLSGTLWLEFTGVFFGLFALSAGIGAWKLRTNLIPPATSSEGRTHALLALAVAVVFAYFCISSFVRASRRGRRS